MTLGQKLKEIRKRFGLSQESLAEIMNVSRQAITKWENDNGIPDISNLKELSNVFGISIDYLLDDNNSLPKLSMKIELDKNKYKNKISMYEEVLKEYYPKPYEIYILSRSKKLNFIETLLDTFIAPEIGPVSTADDFSDLSPYYLIKKDEIKLLVNIKNYVLTVIYLPASTNDKKFMYEKNIFRNCGKLKLTK